MKRWSAFVSLAALVIGLLVIARAAIAEQPASDQSWWPGMGMMGPGMMGPGMSRGGTMGMMSGGCPMMGMMMGRGGVAPSFAEGRIAFLKAELAITDTQASIWDAYAAALRKNFESMQSMYTTMISAAALASPVERLDRHISAMDSRLQSLKEVKPAFAALYAALSDDQKKKADDLLTGMGCMM